ncbi:type IV secretory pathway TraG/TraD family ATPase VirD4 [Polynucleobacter sphagniphilus]|uniref:type IV secretion system DNA-binding domain-containing protein n=1 Tax=Polynucleobacter sphagniphilus TaxID=1743169 RepID=UPI002475B12E|nr:type IV secretion system DNA-binding domain-containing protein [Polynucleobacter sphagniphilus]MDH6302420.1 type IV secretory pathway TraG/TraD family ATPase VirD4 [Polynucleobacter sphagniphilus]
MITGSAGSGKSNELRPLMEQSFALGHKSIVYDPSGNFTELYFRPGKDILFGPANQIITKDGEIIRAVGWSIYKEIDLVTDGKLVASAIVQEADGNEKFWADSARKILSNLLVEQRKRGHTATGDLLRMFVEEFKQELISVLSTTQASTLVGDLTTTASMNMMQTVCTALEGLGLVQDGDFSIRNFICDQNSDARVFITGQVAREELMPLYRVILTLAFNELSLLPEANNEIRCAFFLDEFASLGKLPTISTVLNEMRKYGAMLVCVSQTTSLIRKVYGQDNGKNLLSSFQNLAVYRTQMEEEEKLLAGLLGKQEVIRKNINLTIAVQSNRDGMSENVQQVEQYIVHPSELHLMKIGQCYVRFSGENPVLIDNSLNGDVIGLAKGVLIGKTAKPNRKFIVFDKNNQKVGEGVSDDSCSLSVPVESVYDSYKDFYLVVPPLTHPLNDGISLELNPDLKLTIQKLGIDW